MAQERPLSPEKQLLKFIETSKISGAGVRAQAIKRRGLSFLNLGAWLGRISFLKLRLKKFFLGFGTDQIDIKAINMVLFFFTAGLTIYFFGNLLVSVANLKKIPHLEFKTSGVKLGTNVAETSSLKRSVAYYLDMIRQRDIFSMGNKAESSGKPALTQGPSEKIVEAVKDLRLVGISWSNDPDAMIEDGKALRTFFVKRGQMIGDIKVQAIFKDKVVLDYGGEEIELK